jgi:FlaA1/EpsC-like NDP-sugar epimerase
LISGRSQLTTIRHVELRPSQPHPVVLTTARGRRTPGGRVVMVTGAGGSIRCRACRQRALQAGAVGPLDFEFGLYQIQHALQGDFPGCAGDPVGDVKHVLLIDQKC